MKTNKTKATQTATVAVTATEVTQSAPKKYSKTWEAILKYHGTTIVNDPTLLL